MSSLTDWFGLPGGGGPRGGTGRISAQGKSYKVSYILWFFFMKVLYERTTYKLHFMYTKG